MPLLALQAAQCKWEFSAIACLSPAAACALCKPLGRLLKQRPSPFAEKLQQTANLFPLLCDARDAFNKDFFRCVRNGFADWSFSWNSNDGDVKIELIHNEKGCKKLQISLLEAEALHCLSASAIQIIDEELLRKAAD